MQTMACCRFQFICTGVYILQMMEVMLSLFLCYVVSFLHESG